MKNNNLLYATVLTLMIGNDILKQRGLITSSKVEVDYVNLSIGKDGELEYDAVINQYITPVRTPEYVELNFTMSKS